jgi:hypothetical protein
MENIPIDRLIFRLEAKVRWDSQKVPKKGRKREENPSLLQQKQEEKLIHPPKNQEEHHRIINLEDLSEIQFQRKEILDKELSPKIKAQDKEAFRVRENPN